MELIIQILMMFILLNCILKLSFMKLRQSIVFGVICALFIIVTCRFAILQSKTQLADYLRNIKIMQDIAVLITIETVICLAFCFTSLSEIFGRKIKRKLRFLYLYPGLLIFPVLFYVLTQLIFFFPGIDFDTVSYAFAGSVLIGLPGMSYLMNYLLPERELRLEVYFLVSIFICITGLISTVNGVVVYAPTSEPLNYKAIGYSFIFFVIIFITGYLWNNIKWQIRKKQLNKIIKK